MAINIPSTTAPDYYLSITAPQGVGYFCAYILPYVDDGRWAAIGIGAQMAHSLMFIIAQYEGNVTLSVRLARYLELFEALR